MKAILLQAALLLITLAPAESQASTELVVVVNKQNPTENLTRSQLIDLYMGKYVAFPDGSKAVPVDVSEDEITRKQFYQSLLGMPLARVNAYWSRVKFSGRARPPLKHKDQQSVVEFISGSDDAIGYIEADKVTSNLKVVYSFNE